MTTESVRFRFESEMAEPLIARIPSVFHLDSGKRLRVLRETAIGPVIPDLLLGIWSGDLPRCAGLNPVSRHILAWLSEQKATSSEDQLCERLFLSEHAATSAILALQRVGAIIKRESGEVQLRPEYDVSGSVRLIAIEMKLKRWREALQQSVAYRKFADEAYVVLDGNQVHVNTEVREAFIASGIGLLLQYGEELWSEIMAPPTVPPASVDRLFAVSKLACGPYCFA